MVRDVNTKFSPVVINLDKNLLCTKFEVSRYQKFGFPAKNLKLSMGMAALFFKPGPPNLARIHFELSCKNAEILVMKS